jgi:phosphate transport system substrate-binding protein
MRTLLCEERFGSTGLGFMRAVGVSLLAVVVAGCPAQKPTSETLVIRGSNTIGEELAPRLFAEYQKDHPRIAFDHEFKGTTYGMGALMAGRCDIAAASRPVSSNDLTLAKDRNVEFNDYVIGSYSVAVVVHADNPASNLTQDQVRDIFTGVIQNWNAVGGPDAPIHLYVRDQISGTYLGFRELAMENKPYALNLKTFTSYPDIVQAVARDPNGIGYASIELAMKGGGIKGVSIGGVAPTVATVEAGQYPYTRVLRFYTDKAKEPPTAQEFVQFVQSSRGQQILDEMGYVHRH